ncbi:glycerol-3-phosphate acyltransferase [Meiothermus sp. CFH 77666]|uniref:glycerol-3-phosphate acyltransferase n=1 Tax=Meiothermus sp. CFH 77666 TaxID=2817942 RepID=UPI001AA0643C|nr:glycerol-3-phosphate acyltransferase [Meiothermus sp. CFH 77666]MBO1437500.1 glycerol-3-phosphate acyltransferase [Meiothermus sp. CFH 77666]
MDFLLVLLAYLIGSINFPILAGRLRGWDIRERDLAGTSGVFRQLGKGWGVGVGVLEVGKGMLAAWLAGLSASFWAAPLCALAVVAGHIWPVWFGFRGGGGLAAAGGYALWTFPQETLWSLLVFALGLGVYFLLFKRDRFQGIGSIPFAAILAFLYLAYVLGADARAFYTLLALGGVMALRGVLVLTGRWWHR